ncbi:MAG: type II toxin-antitoxin system VapC family toxin [Thermoanaerobaculia bacterium]
MRRCLRPSSRSAKIAPTEDPDWEPPPWLYLDASALIKLYLPEPDSEAMERALLGRQDILVSDLAVTEAVSSFARRLREGTVERATAAHLSRTLVSHLDEDRYIRVELDRTTHRRAEQLLLVSPGVLRASDALHIALALSASAGALVTFDTRLAAAAQALGLATSAPESGR